MTVVAACQLAPTIGDVAANRERTTSAVEEAVALGAAVVVLPELASSGYAFDDTAEARQSAEGTDGETLRRWQRLAADRGIVLVGGFCERAGEEVFNSAALIDPTGLRAVYRKAHLWERERLVFSAGSAPPPIVETPLGRISTMVCYDLEFPEWVRIPALAGAQLLAAPVNWPASVTPAGERPAEVVRVQANAGVNRMPVVACDRVGDERGVSWVGGTVLTDADGWVVAGGWPRHDEVVHVAELDLAAAVDKRVGELSDVHADRRADLYPTPGWPTPEGHAPA